MDAHQGLLDVPSCISAELSDLFSHLSTDPGAESCWRRRHGW